MWNGNRTYRPIAGRLREAIRESGLQQISGLSWFRRRRSPCGSTVRCLVSFSYSLADLAELTQGLTADDYTWEIGEAGGGRVPIRYLIGEPRKPRLRD
ncbi:MAG: hypothetical protein WB622_07970 [Acidobacteriaceae bacterium]